MRNSIKDAITNEFGPRFLAQPIDVPVALLHIAYVLLSATAALLVVACVLAGATPVEWSTVAPTIWGAAFAKAARDGIAEAHFAIDRQRGLAR